MDPDYCTTYRRLVREHWWWRARSARIANEVERLARPGERLSILEVGCADGYLFPLLERFGEVQGLEPDGNLSGDTTDARIHRRTLENFDTEARFDLILMLDVIEHVHDDVELLTRARDLLRPGGHLLVTVPAFMRLWTSHDVLNDHRRRYDRASLAVALEAAALDARHIEYFFWALYPAKRLQHLLERLRPAAPTAPQLGNRHVNALAQGWFDLENRLAAHFRLPFGGSVLAVAAV